MLTDYSSITNKLLQPEVGAQTVSNEKRLHELLSSLTGILIPLQTKGHRRDHEFVFNNSKDSEPSSLVKRFATGLQVAMNLKTKSLQTIHSRVKWKSTSICFVQALNVVTQGNRQNVRTLDARCSMEENA